MEVEPLFFRQVDGPFHILFRADDRGRITQTYADLMPQYTNVKMSWFETPAFNLRLLLVCVLVFLSMLPVALIRAIRSWLLSTDRSGEPRGPRVASEIIGGICTLNVLFVVGVALWGNPPTELASLLPIAKVVLGLGVVSAALTAGAVVYMVLAWKDRYWSTAVRVYYTLVTVAAVAFVWFLNFWNLLGWRF